MSSGEKRLFRSKSDRIIFGVCGGLAKYFNIDPTLVRIIFVALIIADGIGIILYILLAIIVPLEKSELEGSRQEIAKEFITQVQEKTSQLAEEIKDRKPSLGSAGNIFGLVIIFVGVALLARQTFDFDIFKGSLIWGIIIIFIGLYIIVKKD